MGDPFFWHFVEFGCWTHFYHEPNIQAQVRLFLGKVGLDLFGLVCTFPQTHIMIPNSFCIFEPQRQHNDVVIFYTVLYCLWELRIFFIDTVGPFFQHQAAHFSSSFPMGHWDSHTLTVRRRHFQRSWGAMESLTTSTWRRRGWRGGWGSSLW